MADLDLYGRGASPDHGFSFKKLLPLGLALLLLAAAGTYRWFTISTPVSANDAVELFRAEQENPASERRESGDRFERAGSKRSRPAHFAGGSERKVESPSAPTAVAAPAEDDVATTEEREGEVAARPEANPSRPEEGVYSWSTRGYEEAGGARRSFPEESQRIITNRDGGWNIHHYFSEQREIWTTFLLKEEGVHSSYQRNKVTFGPVTNDSSIDFSPPMLVGPADLKVGQTWEGAWQDETYGTYRGRTFEHVTMDIGGVEVETWGVAMDIELKGEQEGEVHAKVWIAPEYALTVREEYVQDVKADVGRYHAEWSMTLRSLEPRR